MNKFVLVSATGLALSGCVRVSPPPVETSTPHKDIYREADACTDDTLAQRKKEREEVTAIVKGKVLKWGGEIGAEVAREKEREITNSMDRVLDDWARMRQAVCYDHFRRETITADEYQKRVDCLNAILVQQRTFLNTLDSPQVDATAQLSEINNSINGCLQPG